MRASRSPIREAAPVEESTGLSRGPWMGLAALHGAATVGIALICGREGYALAAAYCLVGATAGYLLYRHVRDEFVARQPVAQKGLPVEVAHLLRNELLPIWSRQVGLARDEGNEAVVTLAHSFEALSAKSNEELKTVRQVISELAAPGGTLPLLKESRRELEGLLKLMHDSEATKEAILAEVVRAGDLSSLADEVREMAMQSKLLSLNAAIEAARAGEAGMAFNVVVSEMRQLALRSAEASQRISTQVNQLQSAVAGVVKLEEEGQRRARPIEDAEESIGRVVARVDVTFSQVEGLSNTVEQLAIGVGRDISNSMVALQFQDRISQLLEHTAGSMDELRDSLSEGGSQDWSGAAWQKKWAAHVSMPEEIDSMQGRKSSKVIPQKITFF